MKPVKDINQITGEKELLIQQVISAWLLQNRKMNGLLNKLSDGDLFQPVAPGRNRGIYLLGHLVAHTDMLLPLLDFGDRFYPELDHFYGCCLDQDSEEFPDHGKLRACWHHLNERLTVYILKITPAEWLRPPAGVTVETFRVNPSNNRLALIMSRTAHLSYHMGQLNLLI
jgi:hypothetical protein